MTTLSESLTSLITPLLEKEKLLLPEDAQKFKANIAAGTMKQEDWLLAIEKAIDKESIK